MRSINVDIGLILGIVGLGVLVGMLVYIVSPDATPLKAQQPAAVEMQAAEQSASRGPIRWAANQWNQVGYEVNQLIAKAKRQGHVDVHVDVKGPRGEYTLLQFDVEVKLPK